MLIFYQSHIMCYRKVIIKLCSYHMQWPHAFNKVSELLLCLKAYGHNIQGDATYPSSHSGVTQMRSIVFLTVRAPAEPRQHHDEGDHVEDGGHHREDQLHLQEGEGKLHLDEVPHLQQVEEGPEDGDDEAGDDHPL